MTWSTTTSEVGADTGSRAAGPVVQSATDPGYAAFVSFRHGEPDRTWARWLHGAIEGYRVPRRLRDAAISGGRLGRVFRDEEELAASSDLTGRIREALERSRALIVVCSPRTPGSQWVQAEIDYFIGLGRGDRVFALLVDGEPETAFPPALLGLPPARGGAPAAPAGSASPEDRLELSGGGGLPLAADVRQRPGESQRARKRLAKLRLLAPLLGVSFDDLRRREQERRHRRLALTAAALALVTALVAGLAVWAEINRRSAVTERDRALLNESRFLAGLSQQETARGDGTAGLLLALGSLPLDLARPDRPLLRESLTALYDALLARRELAVFRHPAPVTLAVFGIADGDTLVATGATDGGVRLWSARDGALMADLPGSGSPVKQIAVAAAGDRALTLAQDGVARLWRSADATLLGGLGSAQAPVARAWFNAPGTHVLTQSADRVRLWDARTGTQIADLGVGMAPLHPFDPAGGRLVTFAFDGQAHLWDVQTGQETVALGHGGLILPTGGFGSTGRRVLTASIDGRVRVWDAVSGEGEAQIAAGPFLITATLSPDDRQVATASMLGVAALWDAQTGEPLASFDDRSHRLQNLFFNPRGDRLVTLGDLGAANTLWDPTDGRRLADLRSGRPVFGPDGSRLLTASGGATLWDAGSGRPIATLLHEAPAPGSNVIYQPGGAVDTLGFSPDGRLALTAGQDGTARLWSAADGAPRAVLRGHGAPVDQAGFSPDGTRLLTLSQDGTARLWESRSGVEVPTCGDSGAPLRHLLALGDALALATGAATGTVSIKRLPDCRPGPDLGQAGSTPALVVASPNGTRILTAAGDGTAHLWDGTSGTPIAVLKGHEGPMRGAAFSPDGGRVLTRGEDHSARLWSTESGASLAVLPHQGQVSLAIFSPDGARVLTLARAPSAENPSNWVVTPYLWDGASGDPIAMLKGHTSDVTQAVFSPQRRQVLTASDDGTARLWSTDDGSPGPVLGGHEDYVLDAAFAPDSRTILTVAYDEVARLWDADSGAVRCTLRHAPGVRGARLAPDGSRVLTLSSGGREAPRLWDPASCQPLGDLRGHSHHVNEARFSPDSRRIYSYSTGDGTNGPALGCRGRARARHVAARPGGRGRLHPGWVPPRHPRGGRPGAPFPGLRERSGARGPCPPDRAPDPLRAGSRTVLSRRRTSETDINPVTRSALRSFNLNPAIAHAKAPSTPRNTVGCPSDSTRPADEI